MCGICYTSSTALLSAVDVLSPSCALSSEKERGEVGSSTLSSEERGEVGLLWLMNEEKVLLLGPSLAAGETGPEGGMVPFRELLAVGEVATDEKKEENFGSFKLAEQKITCIYSS